MLQTGRQWLTLYLPKCYTRTIKMLAGFDSTVKMPSTLEAILLPPTQAIGNTLLDNLDHNSLLHLRRCNRSCRNAVATVSAWLFQSLYIHAPLPGNSALREIDIVGPNCRHLTIKVTLPAISRPADMAIAPPKSARNSSLKSTVGESRQSRATSTSSVDAVLDPGALTMNQTLWSHALAWCGRVNKITLRIDGDPGWPGRTSVEDMLVTLRMSLENSRLPQLRVLELQPTHAMGIVHLRWDAFGAWRAVRPSGAQIWRNLTTLKLNLNNPSDAPRSRELRRIIPSQYLMFLKMLQAYLCSFSPTVRCLKFMWSNSIGPSPILLHREQGMEGQEPLKWIQLEELWYGNIAHQRGTLSALPQLAPNLTKIKALRQADKSMGTSEIEIWQDISVPNAYTSCASEEFNDMPIHKEIIDRIEAANAAHAQSRILLEQSTYDHPLSALLNRLTRRPVPRRKLQRVQHQSPAPTRPLPPVPDEVVALTARNALGQNVSQAVGPVTTVAFASEAALEPSTAPTIPGLPEATLPLRATAPLPDPRNAAAVTRVANWRKAMALSTISFADTNVDRDTIFSKTNTDANDLFHDTEGMRPDSMAWPVTRFQAPTGDQGQALPESSSRTKRMWRARDSLEFLASAVLRDTRGDGSESEYSDDESNDDGDRMSILSARVAPLRLRARSTVTGTDGIATPAATAIAKLQPPRSGANTTSSIYSEAGAYGLDTYRPPAR
ncbi:hypothetical protein DOTSEDRAFT_54630 [Dothistroma septosporum NZE10]|uniref:Uncharacterized protein n=1 Tax=Dothistroma septosporum (strain NZE10 / CBS 128990) TaxID=675120 RepID=N1PKZ2_DOTSN|nr:hypothetical protein DOTSEDRAFT_54630 [Dothistroma septosporum NZE10]